MSQDQEDVQGGTHAQHRKVCFHSPLSGRCVASPLASSFEDGRSFNVAARAVCSQALAHPPLAMSFLMGAWRVPEKMTWLELGEPTEISVVLHCVHTSCNRKMLRAIKANDAEQVEYLLSKGQDPNTSFPNGCTALSFSASVGCTDVLVALLAGGAAPNIYGLDGTLPLHKAVERQNVKGVSLLLNQRAEPNLPDGEGKTSALMAAVVDGTSGVQMLQLLREAGADLNIADSAGYTPFGCCDDVEILSDLMDSVWSQLSWKSVMLRNYYEIFQYACPPGAPAVCKIMSRKLGGSSGEQEQESADVLGGSDLEARGTACLLDVWGLLWNVAFWDMLPLAAFCEMKAVNSCSYARMAALRERWEGVRRSLVEGVVGEVITQGLRMPHFKEKVVFHIKWDLEGRRLLERQYMRQTTAMTLPRTIAEVWANLNPEHSAGCQFLAQHAVKCRQALEYDGDGLGVYAIRRVVVQLQLGPARAYLAFMEVRDVEDLTTEESEDSDVQGGCFFHGWLHSVEGDCNYYVPFGQMQDKETEVVPLTEYPMNAHDAAHWFMSTVMPAWETSDLWRCVPSFPSEIQIAIQAAVLGYGCCPVEEKPFWCLRWLLSLVGLQHEAIVQEATTLLLLWAYTWPRSSLKEALCRMGGSTKIAYQHVRDIADWNVHAWDSGVLLIPWTKDELRPEHGYVWRLHGVAGGIWLRNGHAVWTCGRAFIILLENQARALLHADAAMEFYLLCDRAAKPNRSSMDNMEAGDVFGGAGRAPAVFDRVMCLKEVWAQKILRLEKSVELRSSRAQQGFVWIAVGNVIHGSAEIVRCEALSVERFVELRELHCVEGHNLPYMKTPTYGLWLENVNVLQKPVTFLRLHGSCGWAKVRFSAAQIIEAKGRGKRNRRPRPRSTTERHGGAEMKPPPASMNALPSRPPGFTPTIQVLRGEGEDLKLPPDVSNLVGSRLASMSTVGDGACGIHATFGSVNVEGQLQCSDARQVAAEALELALRDQAYREDLHVKAVRLSLWSELALPAAMETGSVEAKLFWKHLSDMYPQERKEVECALRAMQQRDNAATARARVFQRECRNFFLNGSPEVVTAICKKIGYEDNEGLEDAFEERRQGKIVKGTLNTPFPAGGPAKKTHAVREHDPVYDALRCAVFLGRDLQECVAAISEVVTRLECKACIAWRDVLVRHIQQEAEHAATAAGAEPASFWLAATDAYLMAIVEDSYFFSVDELAVIAEVRGQSLVIVKEGEDGGLVPCNVVAKPGPTVMVLVQNANREGPVRSHFERVVPSETLQESGPRPGNAGASLQDEFKDKPWGTDGEVEMEQAVTAVLRAFAEGEDVKKIFKKIPSFATELTGIDFHDSRARLDAAVAEYVKSDITGVDAVYLAMPVWRTCFLPLVVLCEAWSRTTGLPSIFYLESFFTLFSSLLHKQIAYRVGNFACRARYWAVGTAAPGSGKSPALEPLKQALLQVLREMPDLAPGKNCDGFHIQPVSTHIAAVDRLRSTDGYQFFGASEGGPILCPQWPSSSTWNQGTHINWQRYLDAATGGGVDTSF